MAAGYSPAPAVEREMLGLCAEANVGASAGIGGRGRFPIVETDYRRQYAMIYTRQGIGAISSPAAGSPSSRRPSKSAGSQKGVR
jgi:hypothetical protein